jgi:hypothetical protein
MRLTLYSVVLFAALSSACLAQQWEFGGAGGYGWYDRPTIADTKQSLSASAGFVPQAAVGVVFGDNMYEHVGGEVRYLLRFGGAQLKFQGTQANISGYTNVLVYDVLVHITNREAKIRPYGAAGAGIKIYTTTGRPYLAQPQPLLNFALLRNTTQVEPAISVGGGVKYRLSKHALLRFDFRTYMTPLPDSIFRTTGFSSIRGWLFDFVPLAGISYVF